MPVSILHTKLAPPQLKPALVSRPHLTEAISAVFSRGVRLLLVSAPAGYGKTTLVNTWLRRRPEATPSGWLSLDAEDNDPLRFWSYFVAALAEILPGVDTVAAQYLKAPPPLPARSLLVHILNEAATLPAPAVLVLDDYHLIADNAIHQEIAFCLDHLPPPLRLIVSTRVDPPLPVARLRARGQALSLRAADLRFSGEEVAALLNEVKALALSPQQVAAFEARTEGWAAGLEMAALALDGVIRGQGREAVAAFVADFSGVQRYILDYLLEEILSRQPAPVYEFLLQTSILDRFSADLCAAVLAVEEEGEADRGSAPDLYADPWSILDYLERNNLFLLPLDEQQQWYRYHHLFADLLHARLRREWPERIPRLHRRAAGWHEAQGLIGEAITHALKADSVETAARLLEAHTRPLLVRGEMHALLRWIQALPAEVAARRPWLAVYQAWALTLAGHYRQALSLLDPWEAAGAAATVSPAEAEELRGHRAALRTFQWATTGREAEAISQAETALSLLPPDARWPRGLAEWALGYAHRAQGDLAAALPHFAEVVRIGHRQNDLQAIASAQYDLALIRRRQGHLRQALALLEEIMALAAEQGAEDLGYLGRPEAGVASILYLQNQLEEARRHLARSLALNEQWHNPNHDYRAYLTLARLEIGQGNFVDAARALQEAESVAREFAVVPFLCERAAALQAWLWLRSGDLAAAGRWLQARGWAEAVLVDTVRTATDAILAEEVEGLLVALRIHLALAQAGPGENATLLPPLPASPDQLLENVQEALSTLLARSRSAGYGETTLQALILQAMAYRLQEEEPTALSLLEQALALAEPEGYVRPFVDQGALIASLLARCRPRLTGNDSLHRYAGRLLAAFPPATPATPAAQPLVEPLTERELEVLALLAEGLTNRQIAHTLVIARGTVKAHAASIYGKLDVHNRTSAVARARELGLL